MVLLFSPVHLAVYYQSKLPSRADSSVLLNLAINAETARIALKAKLVRAIETAFLQRIAGLHLWSDIHIDCHDDSPWLVEEFAVRPVVTKVNPQP
jgi:hypothetical protein